MSRYARAVTGHPPRQLSRYGNGIDGAHLSRYTVGMHHKRLKCRDCKIPLPWTRGQRNPQRCGPCALKHWRALHPDQVRAQRQRALARDPDHVRELTRRRVARWRDAQLLKKPKTKRRQVA
jgi:hypothetical protein